MRNLPGMKANIQETSVNMSTKQYLLRTGEAGSLHRSSLSYIEAMPLISTHRGEYPSKVPFPAFVKRLPRVPKHNTKSATEKRSAGASRRETLCKDKQDEARSSTKDLKDPKDPGDNALATTKLKSPKVTSLRLNINKDLPPIPESSHATSADNVIMGDSKRELEAASESELEELSWRGISRSGSKLKDHGESITGSILVCYERPGSPSPLQAPIIGVDDERQPEAAVSETAATPNQKDEKIQKTALDSTAAGIAIIAYELPANEETESCVSLTAVEADLQATLDELSPVQSLPARNFSSYRNETYSSSEIPDLDQATCEWTSQRERRSAEKAKLILGIDQDTIRNEWERKHSWFLFKYRLPFLGNHWSRRHSTISTSGRSSVFRPDDIDEHASTDPYHSSVQYRDQFESKMTRRHSAHGKLANLEHETIAELAAPSGLDQANHPVAKIEPLNVTPRCRQAPYANTHHTTAQNRVVDPRSPLSKYSASPPSWKPKAMDMLLDSPVASQPTSQRLDAAPPTYLREGQAGQSGPRLLSSTLNKAKAGFGEGVKEARQLLSKAATRYTRAPVVMSGTQRAPTSRSLGVWWESHEKRKDRLKGSISRC